MIFIARATNHNSTPSSPLWDLVHGLRIFAQPGLWANALETPPFFFPSWFLQPSAWLAWTICEPTKQSRLLYCSSEKLLSRMFSAGNVSLGPWSCIMSLLVINKVNMVFQQGPGNWIPSTTFMLTCSVVFFVKIVPLIGPVYGSSPEWKAHLILQVQPVAFGEVLLWFLKAASQIKPSGFLCCIELPRNKEARTW